MRYNHFSMLPEQAFSPRVFGSMTLEGGGHGGGGSNEVIRDPQASAPPPPPPRYATAGGGFRGRVPYGTELEAYGVLPSQQVAINPDYAGTAWNPEMLNLAYQKILGRAPDTAALQFWPEAFNKGLTGQGFISSLTTSPEFQRTQEFERAYTEAFRPDYKEFGPSGQYFQPIYQSSYSQYMQPPGLYRPSYEAPNPYAYRALQAAAEEGDQGIAAAKGGK